MTADDELASIDKALDLLRGQVEALRKQIQAENVNCRGSYALGSACGKCPRCFDELRHMHGAGKLFPVEPFPAELFDAYGVLQEIYAKLDDPPAVFMNAEAAAAVSAVLDAVVRLIRKRQNGEKTIPTEANR